MKYSRIIPLALLLAAAAAFIGHVKGQNTYSNPYTITTLAGNYNNSGNLVNGQGTAAAFANPNGVAVDSAGNVYVADTLDYAVRKISPTGLVTTLAGGATMGEADGLGTAAQFGPIKGIAVDANNYVYVSDWVNFSGGPGGAIRKIAPNGQVTTLVSGILNSPLGLTLDLAGNVYVADSGNSVIRKIPLSGAPSVYAGTAGKPGFADGAAGTGQLAFPTGVAFDPAGNLYVTDAQGDNVRKVSSSGTLSLYAGSTANPSEQDGTLANATFTHPAGLAADAAGNLYLADNGTVIREITAGGMVSTLAGTSGRASSLDGTGANAAFNGASGIAATATGGTIYVADTNTSLIRMGVPLANPAPSFQYQPNSQMVYNGGPLTLTAAVTGLNLTYQWSLNGTPIAGATSASYTLSAVGADQAGTYTLTASNSYGSVTSKAAVITVNTLSRIVNLSSLDVAGTGANVLAAGFGLSGSSSVSKILLVRGIGPTLANFGVPTVLATPQLTLYDSTSTAIAANTGWANNPQLAQAFTATGAFALPAGSVDCALLATLSAGKTYSAQVAGAGGATGNALVEIYDDDLNNIAAQLVNISTSAKVTPSAPLTAGFALQGSTSVTVVIRGIGPALTGFGVPSALGATTLNLYDGSSHLLSTNTRWGGTAALTSAFSHVGAFALPAASADSALLVSLPPGNYSAQVSSADGSSGVALVEVYQLQ